VGNGGLTAEPAADRRGVPLKCKEFPGQRGFRGGPPHALFTALLRIGHFALAESIPIG